MNNKIPAIIDPEGPDGKPVRLAESGNPFNSNLSKLNIYIFSLTGAILLYLAEKYHKLIPIDSQKRADVLQWLFWQMSSLGPIIGQYHHFKKREPVIDYAVERFSLEINRLLTVLEIQLKSTSFVAGEYSVADICIFPWVYSLYNNNFFKKEDYPNVMKWVDVIQTRPAVQRGLKVCRGEDLKDPQGFATFTKPANWKFDASDNKFVLQFRKGQAYL